MDNAPPRTSLETFHFRNLHPLVHMGTASDRYAGWIGQIYSAEHYRDRITGRAKTVGKNTYNEQVLPVESVGEYFRHFPVLELDFTFYRLLLDPDGKPTPNYRVLETYRKHLTEADRLLLKVPQVVFARKLRRGGAFVQNPDPLNPETFTRLFYEPALAVLGESIGGFVFEQEYQTKKDNVTPDAHAASLDAFFARIPPDARYHCEVRTPPLLTPEYFELLDRHGVGQVLSHWTWLPPLWKQFAMSAKKFSNRGGRCLIRLMTPRGMRYEDAYAKAFPFNALVEGMLQPSMVRDAVRLMHAAVDSGVHADIVVNNRSGGNAPLIARTIAETFLEGKETA